LRVNGIIYRMTQGDLLHKIYSRLRCHFGYTPRWWPGSPMEIFVTAVLVQQCDWSQAWDASQRLKGEKLLRFSSLMDATQEQVESLIRPVAFSPTKAKRLVEIASQLVRRGYDSVEPMLDAARETDAVRSELLSLPGIGEETADCILLYAGKRPVFVVDAYTRRAFSRLIAAHPGRRDFWQTGSYKLLQKFFETSLRSAMGHFEEFELDPAVAPMVGICRDYHAQIVELAKHHCLRTRPRCEARGVSGWKGYFFCEKHCPMETCDACPLVEMCPSGRKTSGT